MKLKRIAWLALRGIGKYGKGRIADGMGTTIETVTRWIKENSENGPLTTAKALQLITEETGLSDHEILEEDVDKSNSGQGDVVLTLG